MKLAYPMNSVSRARVRRKSDKMWSESKHETRSTLKKEAKN